MGRPKGSKNKPKRGRRRQRSVTINGALIDTAGEALELRGRIHKALLDANPLVARVVVRELIPYLTMVDKILEGMPPAP